MAKRIKPLRPTKSEPTEWKFVKKLGKGTVTQPEWVSNEGTAGPSDFPEDIQQSYRGSPQRGLGGSGLLGVAGAAMNIAGTMRDIKQARQYRAGAQETAEGAKAAQKQNLSTALRMTKGKRKFQ